MSNSFGPRSKHHRATLHSDLIEIVDEGIETIDFSILCGNRSRADQEAAYPKYTKVRWPGSRHNQSGGDFDKSDAFDAMPYPIEWPDPATDHPLEFIRKMRRIYDMAERFLSIAAGKSITLRWGGMFRGFRSIAADAPHFERDRG